MSDARDPERERLLDLLADRSMEPISKEAAAALEVALASGSPLSESDSSALDRAAAALATAFVGSPREDLPRDLASRIALRGKDIVAARPAPAAVAAPSLEPLSARMREPLRASLGWYVAAAALLLAAAAYWPALRDFFDPATPARELRRFESSALDKVTGEWKAMKEFEGRRVSGRCEWSDSLQRGFLVFRGLPPNAASSEQYQLWIIVAGQKYPIDGGVFDAPRAAGDGETVVPVAAKLPVALPSAFAVTIEKPGGVVVSDQSRLVLQASLSR